MHICVSIGIILCAVFLYNICFFFHDFIETSTPIEKQWTTLFHYYMEKLHIP